MQRVEVELEVGARVATVRLPVGTWTRRAALELDDILAELAEDDSDEVRVIVLAGAGPDFCVGPAPDLKADAGGVDPPARLAASRRPVIAAVSGSCRSVGVAIALAADIRVVDPACRFALPEVPEGRVPPWNAISLAVRVMGPARATPVVLLGAEVSGRQATAVGWAHEVCEEPEARAAGMATQLAERGPLALEYAKEAIWRGVQLPMGHAMRLEADFNHLLQGSSDRAEGLTAFFEKRQPGFTGE